MQHVKTDHAPSAIGPYSQGIIANGVLYSAGQIALDPATGQMVQSDIVAQTERVMENLESILEAAGDLERRRENDRLSPRPGRLSHRE